MKLRLKLVGDASVYRVGYMLAHAKLDLARYQHDTYRYLSMFHVYAWITWPHACLNLQIEVESTCSVEALQLHAVQAIPALAGVPAASVSLSLNKKARVDHVNMCSTHEGGPCVSSC